MSPGKEFDRFQELLEKHFLKTSKEKINDKRPQFIKELDTLGLSKAHELEYLIWYFINTFWTGALKTTDRPLHSSRDYALELFAKVFSDRITVQDSFVKNTNLFMFLAGIIDNPYKTPAIANKIELFAKSDETVLITGETGTGKELHAKVIHYLSNRLNEPFIAINCAGIPDTLLESELFGITKGAATGVAAKEGILNTVGDGTLFLDEIGDMPLALQAKILRVLQSRQFNKIGDPKKIYHFRGRVIAATNRDINKEIKKSPPTFRPDLYYRLNVLPIELPPLRDLEKMELKIVIRNKLLQIIYSKTDVPGTLRYWEYLYDGDDPITYDEDGEFEEPNNPYIEDEALQYLANYNFPGNYRELDNIITRAYILAKKGKIEVSALPEEVIINEKSKMDQQSINPSAVDVDKICLKDIIKSAQDIKKEIVRRKVESIYSKGQDVKSVLRREGKESSYQNIRKKIETIIGKDVMAEIVKRK